MDEAWRLWAGSASLLLALGGMGLASLPHCALMCGAPCAAAAGTHGRGQWAFHVGRVLSYAAAGALAAASLGALREVADASQALRPLWQLLQLGLLVLGGWLLLRGQWPAWVGQIGRRPGRGAAAGLAWAAWPCGVLQGALLVAALAPTPWIGAAAMAVFAVCSAPGLVAAPVALRRLAQRHGTPWVQALSARLAGTLLLGAAVWALGHGLWPRVAALCGL